MRPLRKDARGWWRVVGAASSVVLLLALSTVAFGEEAAGEATPPPQRAEEPSPTPEPSATKAISGPKHEDVFFEAYWDQGVRYRLLGRVKLVTWRPGEPFLTREPLLLGNIGFKLHVDAAGYAEGKGVSGINGGIEVRRSFLDVDGTFFNEIWPLSYSFEFGVITGSFYFSEGYLMLKDLPYVGSFKVGQYTAPLSLDALISSRDRTFMEPGSPVAAFSLGVRAGMQIADYLPEHEITYAVGWFADGQDVDVGEASDSLARLAGRMTWMPYEDRATSRLVHLGLGLSYLYSNDGNVRYRSRPESFLAPFVIDTDKIDSRNAAVVGAEAAFVSGPLSGQLEYLHAIADGDDTGNVNFPGVYLSLSSFMTGETRPYRRDQGKFGQVIPIHPLSWRESTWGAFEWAGRYSFTSLDSGPVHGGKMHCVAGGLNWYWNRYIRWQFNYVFSAVDDGVIDGNLHTFQMRFQLVI